MWRFAVLIAMTLAKEPPHPAEDQLVIFKQNNPYPIGTMTTGAGMPIEYKEATSTLNSNLLSNEYFVDSITNIVRERIPVRIVHAKGAGGFGYFQVTHDITDICKAKLFDGVGKKTPIAARFSLANADKGASDTLRDARGFALKFYTEEGNFDIIGFNTPIFEIKDPILFTTFIRTQRRNPVTNLIDPIAMWDFLTLHPETLHIFMAVFGDRGIPDGYRHMPGFGIHTYQVANKNGESHFIRFHFMPDAGIKNLQSQDAQKISAEDPDYATRDLYNAIATGKFPSWTVSIQVLSLEDVKNATFDVFDVTKVLPLDKYPLKPLGKIVLNKNPSNYFAEIEQLAFCPSNLVPGILGGPDKVFEARRFSYRDAQNYRLGGNFMKIPVNCPMRSKPLVYNRDGVPPVLDNMNDVPNYYPNSFNGPDYYIDKNRTELIKIYEDAPNVVDQARELYTHDMNRGERTRLVENLVNSLVNTTYCLQDKAVKLFTIIHPDLGNRISQGLQNMQANSTKYEKC